MEYLNFPEGINDSVEPQCCATNIVCPCVNSGCNGCLSACVGGCALIVCACNQQCDC